MEHESWIQTVLSREHVDAEREGIQAFRLGEATIAQDAAIRSYMWQEGKADLRGMHMWLKAREMTYYDILRKVSP